MQTGQNCRGLKFKWNVAVVPILYCTLQKPSIQILSTSPQEEIFNWVSKFILVLMVFLCFSLSLVSNSNATSKTIRCSKSITKCDLVTCIFPRFREFACFYFWVLFGFLCKFSFLWLAVVVGFGLAILHRKELYLHLLYCPQIVGIGGRYGSPITRNGIERSYYQPWFCHCNIARQDT